VFSPSSAVLKIQRWWRARPSGLLRVQLALRCAAAVERHQAKDAAGLLKSRDAVAEAKGAAVRQHHSSYTSTCDDFSVDTLDCSPQSAACRQYCPSRYEDSSLPQLSTGQITQLRSKIRSLRELRGQSDAVTHESAQQPALSTSGLPSCTPATSSRQPPVQHPPQPAPSMSRSASQPPQAQDKLTSILSFLDEVEESSRADISSLVSSARSSRAAAEVPGGHLGDGCMPSALAQGATALQSRISLLEVEVHDKKSIIDALKQALAEARAHEKRALEATSQQCDEKLQKQREHYEAGLERHLKLVDRLLNDKTELTKRCELFTEEMKAVERRYQMKMEELDQQASKDLARHKQNWMAAEKLRREAWEKDKVREIKEMTVKGLQPEVERLLAERKQERQRLVEQQREALETQRQELLALAQERAREVREQLQREHDEALDREREAHRRKLREEFERFSGQLQEERSRCAADLLAERRRHEQMLQQGAEGCEARLREALAGERSKAEAALQRARAEAAEAQDRQRAELEDLERRSQAELERRERARAEAAAAALEQREVALRAELAAERDRQLEALVERLSREHAESQRALKEESTALSEKLRAEAEQRTQRLAQQLEEQRAHAAALEARCALAEERANGLQDRRQTELARVADLEGRVRALEAENASLLREAEQAVEQHRKELQRSEELKNKDLEALREELQLLNARLAGAQLQAEEQQREAKRHEERLIGDLEVRVKRTVQAKDDTIRELRAHCAASENKVREFEYLLTKQREELLRGIKKDMQS